MSAIQDVLNSEIENIKAQITALKEDTSGLYKTIYQGNGTPAIVKQLTELAGKQHALRDQQESLETQIDLKLSAMSNIIDSRFAAITNQFQAITTQISAAFKEKEKTWDFKSSLIIGIVIAVITGLIQYGVTILTK